MTDPTSHAGTGTGELRALLREWSDRAKYLETRGQDDEAWQVRACIAQLRGFEGWRPPLPEADVRLLRSLVAGIIDEHVGGEDQREASMAAAQEIVDRGWLDTVGEIGPPEPVATTLRRIIKDLEGEALFRDPVHVIGQYSERGPDDIIGARTLREYAIRLRGHPALDAERDAGWPPLPASHLDVVRDFCAERAEYITAINNCHPDNDRDYKRWNGHAEARRQLSERLGLPTAWPAKEENR